MIYWDPEQDYWMNGRKDADGVMHRLNNGTYGAAIRLKFCPVPGCDWGVYWCPSENTVPHRHKV